MLGFAIARFALGIGESGNFPAAIKTVAEWFPKKERAFATGIFNGGSNVGAILAPLVVPILFAWHGWQTAFIATGLVGLVWVFFWWPIYRRPQEHPRVSPAELAYIESDPPDPPVRVPWLQLAAIPPDLGVRHRQVPHRFDLVVLPVLVPQVHERPVRRRHQDDRPADDHGLPARRRRLDRRRLAKLAAAGARLDGQRGPQNGHAHRVRSCIVPVAAAPLVADKWVAVLLIGIAAAAHQGFSANLFTLTSDMFPRRVVGSVVGIGGFAGAMGGFLMNLSRRPAQGHDRQLHRHVHHRRLRLPHRPC